MSVKLQLDLAALERLLGGDTEVEVGLRQSVVDEFARRHLRGLMNEETAKAVQGEVKKFVNETIAEQFGVENIATSHLWPTVQYRFKSVIETLVKEAAQKAVDEALKSIIEYQKRYWSKEIENAVKKGYEADLERRVREEVDRRLALAKEMK